MARRSRRPRRRRNPRNKVVAFQNMDFGLRLEIKEQAILNGAGRALANFFRKRMRSGVDGYGRRLPGLHRMRDSGALIRSLKWDARSRTIFFKGTHPSGTDNAKIAAANIFGLIGGDYDSKGRVDPLLFTAESDKATEDGAVREIEKQVKKGKGRLIIGDGFGGRVDGAVRSGFIRSVARGRTRRRRR